MLKFEKNGKKLMEMDEEGNILFYDEEFKKKMKEAKENVDEREESADSK